MSFLDWEKLLYKHQYGFRAKHSTSLLKQCAKIKINSNPRKYTLYFW